MTTQQHHRPLARRAGLGLVFAALAASLMSGCSLLPNEPVETPPPLVAPQQIEKDLVAVHKGSVLDKVSLRAIFAPAQQQRLYFRQGGLIKAVGVKAGDTVAAGQVLVELETGELAFDLEAAQINQQKAQLALADVQAKAAKGQASDYEVKSKELDLDLANVTVSRLQERLRQSRLVAPFGGLVMSVAKKVGETAGNAETMVEIADPSNLLVVADVTADGDLARLQVGQKVRLAFDELTGGGGEGTLVQMPDTKVQGPEARQVKVRLDKPDPKAKQGLVGKIHVILQEKQNVLVLSNAAIRTFTGRTYVIMQTEGGKREVDIVPGIAGETETEIVKGLKDGDQVIGR